MCACTKLGLLYGEAVGHFPGEKTPAKRNCLMFSRLSTSFNVRRTVSGSSCFPCCCFPCGLCGVLRGIHGRCEGPLALADGSLGVHGNVPGRMIPSVPCEYLRNFAAILCVVQLFVVPIVGSATDVAGEIAEPR